MISHHPSSEMLLEFSEASVSTAASVAVAAHLSLCTQCRDKAADLEAGLAEGLLGGTVEVHAAGMDLDIQKMASAISSRAPIPQAVERSSRENEIQVEDLTIGIPAVLGKLATGVNRWKHYRNGVSLANVPVDNISQCDFLYMKPGGKVPMHTHGGTEITLVLDGKFRDDDGEYNVGDFLVRDASDTHTTESDTGCLCFAVLEKPVVFKKGPARLLNLWNRLSFPSGQTHL